MADIAEDERILRRAVREHRNSPQATLGAIRQLDRDRSDVARALDRADVQHDDIADVCGVAAWQVPAVLRGERVTA